MNPIIREERPSGEEEPPKRIRSATPISVSDVMRVVMPILQGLLKDGFLSLRQVGLIHAFIPRTGIEQREFFNQRCHAVLKCIIPAAKPCEWEDFPEAVDTLVRLKENLLFRQIYQARPPYRVDTSKVFPFVTAEPGAQPSHFSAICVTFQAYAKSNPFFVNEAIKGLSIEFFKTAIRVSPGTEEDPACFKVINALERELKIVDKTLVREFGKYRLAHAIDTLTAFNFTKFPSRLELLVQCCNSPELPEQKQQLIAFLKTIYDARAVPLSVVPHIEISLKRLDPDFVPRQNFKLVFKEGEKFLTEFELVLLKFHMDFFETIEESRWEVKTLDLRSYSLHQFYLLLSILKSDHPYILKPIPWRHLEEWIALFTLACILEVKDLNPIIEQLNVQLLPLTENGLTDFLRFQDTFVLSTPRAVEKWVSKRDEVIRDFFKKCQKFSLDCMPFLMDLIEFEKSRVPGQEWMRVRNFTWPYFPKKVVEEIAHLESLQHLALPLGCSPATPVLKLMPRLQSLVISLCGVVYREKILAQSQHLEKLTVLLPQYNSAKQWRVLSTCSTKLRVLCLWTETVSKSRRKGRTWDETWIHSEDRVLYPNLRLFFNNVEILRGINVTV